MWKAKQWNNRGPGGCLGAGRGGGDGAQPRAERVREQSCQMLQPFSESPVFPVIFPSRSPQSCDRWACWCHFMPPAPGAGDVSVSIAVSCVFCPFPASKIAQIFESDKFHFQQCLWLWAKQNLVFTTQKERLRPQTHLLGCLAIKGVCEISAQRSPDLAPGYARSLPITWNMPHLRLWISSNSQETFLNYCFSKDFCQEMEAECWVFSTEIPSVPRE